MGGGDKDTAFTLPQHISISQKGEHPPIHAKKKKIKRMSHKFFHTRSHICAYFPTVRQQSLKYIQMFLQFGTRWIHVGEGILRANKRPKLYKEEI